MGRGSSSVWSSALFDGADVIVARATPEGQGALAVIRCSGAGAFRCVARTSHGFDPQRGWRVQRVEVVDRAGEAIDGVLATAFPGPRSATGEDVVELVCHGSPYVTRGIVQALVDAGARPAGPGEFTRRAMANGKLDLVQAEALRDLIAAETRAQARAARRQLEGRLSERLGLLRDGLVELLARLEGGLDLVGHGVTVDEGDLRARVEGCRGQVDRLLATAAAGARLRGGARVVILGPANAGKSTLFNQLLGWDRAIVSSEPGTTRDAVEARLEIEGVMVTLVDTAGERSGGGEVELAGMRHARREAAEADLAIRLWPADGGLEPPAVAREDVRVRSKCDLLAGGEAEEDGWILVCGVSGSGVERVRGEIASRLLGGVSLDEDGVAIGARHEAGLTRCRQALEGFRADLPEVAAECIREAISTVREMIGEVTSEDLLDVVFATFCVGK